jgi:DNA polymerase III epsilon subunit-like protein
MTKNQNLVLVLAVVFGWLGAHRFYVGKIGTGVLYLFTFGLFGIGWAVDALLAAVKVMKDRTLDSQNSIAGAPKLADSSRRPNLKYSSPVAVKRPDFSTFLESNEFVAVDVEWADSRDRKSVCEIGLARFSGGLLQDTYRNYVRPEGKFELGAFEFRTHGIDRTLIENAQPLLAQWEAIEKFVGGRPWVLHNATQDITKILSSLGATDGKRIADYVFFDTMTMARKVPVITGSNGLTEVADFLGVKREWALYDGRAEAAINPHGALEDATVTGEILLRMVAAVGYETVAGFVQLVGQIPGLVQQGEIVAGVSTPGKFAFPDLSSIPDEHDLLASRRRAELNTAKTNDKRALDEVFKNEFLKNPSWSEMKVGKGMKICFTQLVPWDETREEGFDQEVISIAAKMGVEELGGIRKDLDLLIVNDPWVSGSAKLRDALARGIPVTTYSVFQKNNPECPVWRYKNAPHYRYLRAEGLVD